MTVNIRGPVFWNAMQCTVVYSYQCCYKEHGVSILMEVIHQTTQHHMPEDTFLQKLKFYTAHWSTIVNKRTRLSVSHSVLPNFSEISVNQSIIFTQEWKLKSCGTFTDAQQWLSQLFVPLAWKCLLRKKLYSLVYSTALLTFIQPGWYLNISAWFM